MLKKKELIIFNPSIEDGGVEKNLYLIANFLSKNLKSNISLITSSKYKTYKFEKNIRLIIPPLIDFRKFNRPVKYLVCLFLLTLKILFKRNVLILSFQANIYAIIIAKIFNVKIITRSNTSPKGWSNSFFKRKVFRFFLKKADEIIVNSQYFKKQLDKEFNLNTVLILNPLNTEDIKNLSKKKIKLNFFFKKKQSLKIINIGRMTDQKDHMTLLKAFRLVCKKINSNLIILGKGKNYTKIKNFITDNNLHTNVKLLGFKENPYPYIKLSDIFVLTSKFEGLPNVLLESIFLKKPIISTDCPTGPKEILSKGKYGKLVKVGDYKNIAKALINFYRNKKVFTKKIILGYKDLKRFDFQINCLKYLEIIKKYI
jgi:glycosyltransferase involved in cell wall biosynthesis